MKTCNFLENYKKVGVMVSGGLDSALLLYLLLKENKEKGNNCSIDALTVFRSDDAKNHSYRIINVIENLLNVTVSKIEVGNPNTDCDNQVISGIFDAIVDKKYEHVFLATTTVPNHLIDSFDRPVRSSNVYPKLSQPWMNITKDNIVKYIVNHKLFSLIENSHSCTGLQYGHCGICFNCKERQWAFEQNNFKDNTKF